MRPKAMRILREKFRSIFRKCEEGNGHLLFDGMQESTSALEINNSKEVRGMRGHIPHKEDRKFSVLQPRMFDENALYAQA